MTTRKNSPSNSDTLRNQEEYLTMARRTSRSRPRVAARGERNNNPLNIRWLPPERAWRGQEQHPDAPGGFGVYATPEDGIRAAIKQMALHILRGHDTLAKLIAQWAPSTENDVEAYVSAVCAETGVPPDAPLDPEDGDLLLALAQAMARHENGYLPYADGTWRRGLTASGLGDGPRDRLTSSRTIGGAAVGGGASIASLAAGALYDHQDVVVSGVQAIASGPQVIMFICAGVTLACAAYVAYARYTDWKDGCR